MSTAHQGHTGVDVKDPSTWYVVYPIYLNSNATVAQGRRVSKAQSCPNPKIQEIIQICKFLGFSYKLEMKAYPRDFRQQGRLRVLMVKEDGSPINPEIKKRIDFYRFCGEKIPLLKSRTDPPKPKEASKQTKGNQGNQHKQRPPQNNSRNKKKKKRRR
jgi:signal recognition particle subunit SRP19